jgi:hypothetical protein
MIHHVKAIYDHGVLRPLEPLDLDDQAVVSLSIDAPADKKPSAECGEPDLTTGETLFDAFDKAGLIGCIKGAPSDLSTNPRHMEGFGSRG